MGGTQDNGTWSNRTGCDTRPVHAGDLRRRRQRRLRRDQPDVALQPVHERVQRLELPQRRSGEVGHHVGADRQQRRGVRRSTGRRSPTRTRSPGAHPIYSGAQHVWRTWAFGAGYARRGAAGQEPGHRVLRGELPRVQVVGARSELRRLPAAGRAVLRRSPTRTDVHDARRPDRHGVRRRPRRRLDLVDRPQRRRPRHALGRDLGRPHLRDAQRRCSRPGGGRLAPDRQLDRRSPTRFPSGIYADPDDTGHAWISYSGYNANTPTTPGHVFEVSENGAAPGSGRSRT